MGEEVLPKKRFVLFYFAGMIFGSICSAAQIKVSIVSDNTEPASVAMVKSLRQQIASFPKQFTLVNNNDVSNGLAIVADCMARPKKETPYICFYNAHYAGGTSKTLLGGGVYMGATPDEVAQRFLASIAQDITESWNNTVRANAIEALESCLFLTQSSCAVPHALATEIKTKTLNLSQYLQKGGLKK